MVVEATSELVVVLCRVVVVSAAVLDVVIAAVVLSVYIY